MHRGHRPIDGSWRDELAELIAIPSVSADPAHRDDVSHAGQWLAEYVKRAGGAAALTPFGRSELLIGEIAADDDPRHAPTVLVYGHFDVQPPGPLELWHSPPFELVERDGWVYGRGVADDKGQLYALIKGAQLLKQARRLPVNVRVVCDGEEEIGGHTIADFLGHDDRRIDACVVFDAGRKRAEQPEFNIGCRGVIAFRVVVRTGRRDLHSGMYGGVALNATHALMQALTALLPRGGLLADELRAGRVPLSADERRAAAALPTGEDMLAQAAAAPLDDTAAAAFYERIWAEPSIDVNGIRGGDTELLNTTLPCEAQARLTIRLAPGQDATQVAATAEDLLRDALPAGAELALELENLTPPGLIVASAKALQLAADAFARALGRRPLFVRMGGTLPIVPALAARRIPTVISGFALPDSRAHAPNERMRVEDVELSVRVAQELFAAWRTLA